MAETWDVTVVGAGPGGAIAAYHLARFGYEVLLLDRAKFPRHKPCGGALSKKVAKFLPFEVACLDVDEIYGAEFTFKGEDRFLIAAETPMVKLVSRREFDHQLVKTAVVEGVHFVEGKRVVSVHQDSKGFGVVTSEGTLYKTRYLIGAHGPMGPCARFLNPRASGPMGISLEEEVAIGPLDEKRYVYLDFGRFPWGYGWVFPKKGLSSVGCGAIHCQGKVSLKANYEAFKRGFPFLQRAKGRLKGHLLPYFGEFHHVRAEGCLLLVGDTARLMDPFLGEGIYYALASGTFAAEAVRAALEKGKRADHVYLARLQKEVVEELKWAARIANFVYPRLGLSYKALKRLPGLGLLYVKVMSGEVSYRDFNTHLFYRAVKGVGKGRLKGLLGLRG